LDAKGHNKVWAATYHMNDFEPISKLVSLVSFNLKNRGFYGLLYILKIP
jgi:hypothetical protein